MRRSQVRSDVTDAELQVLKVLWDDGPATIRQLVEVLYPGGGTSAHATVQKLLERLEAKGCVSRRSRGRANEYRAKVEREALIAHRLQETADALCEGSMTPLLSHLLEPSRLREDDVRALRDLVERLDDQRSRRRR